MSLFETEKLLPQVSIDCVVFGYNQGQLKVLITEIDFVDGFWSLPGGFIFQNETLDQAAHRILEERTGLRQLFLEQFWVFDGLDRNNNLLFDALKTKKTTSGPINNILNSNFEWFTNRFISIGYFALVDQNKVKLQTSTMDKHVGWQSISLLPKMIMDHNQMVHIALRSLQLHLDERLIAFNLLPETFTMKELQELYEAVYNKPLARNNFQKKMLDLNVLERLDKKYTGAANKAPYLYRFVQK
jgi:8-oxo-dGTP diphosphatase